MESVKQNTISETTPITTTQPITQAGSDILPTGIASEQAQGIPSSPEKTLSSEVKAKSKNILLRTLIIIVVLLIFVFSGFWVYETYFHRSKSTENVVSTPASSTNPMINWITYTNTVYGFSLKYPDSWNITDRIISDIVSNVSPDGKPHQFDLENDNGIVEIMINPELPLGTGGDFVKSTKEISSYTVDAYSYNSKSVVLYNNFGFSKLPNFSISTYWKNNENDQILSSFEFKE